MKILFLILVLLATARIFSEVAERFRIPALVGEIIAGILLGAVFQQFTDQIPYLANLHDNEVFTAITDLGIFFLMLYAGIELHPQDVGEASVSSIWVAIGGMVIPLALGFGFAWFLFPASDYRSAQSLFLGVALAITAVPVVIKVLMDLKKLQESYSKVIVSAAVIDDVLSLLLLAILTAFIESGAMPGWQDLAILAVNVLVFFAVTIGLGRYLFPWMARLVIHRSYLEESEFSILLIVSLAFSVLAEMMDMHFILGAFIAGLFFAKREIPSEIFHDVQNKVSGITTGFLAPIFFASIGLSLDLSSMREIPFLVVGLIVIASAGKILGAGIPARLIGFNWKEAMVIGNGMNARGAVELIIADIALRAGLFSHPEGDEVIGNLFSAVVIMAIVTTVMTPITVKWLLRRDRRSK